MTRQFGARLSRVGLMAQDQPVQLQFLRDPPAAMIDEPGVMIAGDPQPVEPRGQPDEQFASIVGQTVAAEAVVERVAETIERGRAACLDLPFERLQRGERIVGREHLPRPREPAGLFEVQVGHQHGVPRRPVKRAIDACREGMTGERKGNHVAAIVGSRVIETI